MDITDINVGKKIKERRLQIGISQSELAKLVGVTFQQIQKYESGKNRVSASRLYHIAHELRIGINFFYDLNDKHKIFNKTSKSLSDSKKNYGVTDDTPPKDIKNLIKFYKNIEDEKIKKNILELCKKISKSSKNK